MTAPDVVYVVRPGENPELRFSLRSVHENLPHGRVFVVGTVLPWLRDIIGVPLFPLPEKFANQRQSLTAAVAHQELSEQFILLNDDHFITEPVTGVPTFHLGRWLDYRKRSLSGLGEALRRNTWFQTVEKTAEWVTQFTGDDPLTYEAHVPLMFDKSRLREVLTDYPQGQRFAVGMTYALTGGAGEGIRGSNVKVKYDHEFADKVNLEMPYISCNEHTFADGHVGRYIRSLFADPSPYEEAT